jgi:murein L,D-transpeptidase YcbB/YkuD
MHKRSRLTRRRTLAAMLVLFSVAAGLFVLPLRAGAETPSAAELRARIETANLGFPARLPDALANLYRARDFRPIWAPDDAAARLVEAALGEAESHGLDPATYHSYTLAARGAERELMLSDGLLALATHLRQGRVDPGMIETDWALAPDPFDAAASLAAALERNDLAAWLASLPPPHPGYRQLRESLARYRAMTGPGGWPLVAPGPELRLDGDARLPALRRRLEIEGDLIAGRALIDAVRRFQERHGLNPDGRIGRLTQAALAVSAERRVAQIALNLERWRSLPRAFGERRLIVNAAAAQLVVENGGATALAARTIVGDSRHPTPVFRAQIDEVAINPPWVIPPSIARKEILPRLRRNRDYLAANDMIIANGTSDPHARDIDWGRVRADYFPFQLVQRPGPQNALGRLKFEMPNAFNVYLHDTPGKAAFRRDNRALSHGCVRVEHPLDLAVYLLEPAGWPAERIVGAIEDGATLRLKVARPLPVWLLYFTAAADADGTTRFYDDLYGRDARLAAALAGASAPTGSAPGGCRG